MDEDILDGNNPESPKPSVQRRLEFIDFRLFGYGKFNRRELAHTFKISPQQASTDISLYEDRAPNNLRYDHGIKAYVRGEDFKPLYMRDLSDRYLLQLVSIQNGWLSKDNTWFDTIPPSDVVALKRKQIDPTILQRILDAIREKLELEVGYNSINSAQHTQRWIAPHAIAYSAGRWHVRAWSKEHNDFRDFNLSRIDRIARQQQKASVDSNLDYEWNNYIDLHLAPNPELESDTQEAVKAEYNIRDGHIVESMRLSLVFYFMNEHNLDVEPGKLNPRKQQLVLLNKEEVEAARKLTRKMSAEALKRAMLA